MSKLPSLIFFAIIAVAVVVVASSVHPSSMLDQMCQALS